MFLALIAAAVAQAAPPAMPNVPPASPTGRLFSKSDPEYASLRAFNDFVAAMMEAEPDAKLMVAMQEVQRIQQSLPEISHRQPFDAPALKTAYRDLALARGRLEARRNEIVVERLAALSPANRALVIERIPYLEKPMTAAPPPR